MPHLAAINVVTSFMYSVDKCKTKKLKWRISAAILLGMTLLCFASCRTKQNIESALSVQHDYIPEHSPSVLIIMYDPEAGKESLLKAVKESKAEILYDYSVIPGMAIKKPDDKTLDETMRYFKEVKGVVSVEYDRVYHLTDPVKPKIETK